MGSLTRLQLINQAGLASGNDQTSSFVHTWINAWLRRTAKSWAWPYLKQRITALPIAASAASVVVGNGTHSDLIIHRIFNPLFYRTSDYKQRGRILIRELLDGNPDKDEGVTQASDRLGAPTTVKIRSVTTANIIGRFTLYPDPVPDKAYLIDLDVHALPPDLSGDSSVPWYPSDKTLLQAYKCALLEFDDGGEGGKAFDQEMAKLGAMVIDDRDFDGEGAGDNQVMALDKSVFL